MAAGKSQTAKAMLDADQADVLADTSAIYAALSGDERDSNGRYPSRPDGALLLPLALYVRQAVVREGLRRDLRVLKTSSTKTDLERDRALASELGASFREIVIDPGENVVRGRLRDPQTGTVSPDCESAISRYYRPGGRR